MGEFKASLVYVESSRTAKTTREGAGKEGGGEEERQQPDRRL